MEITAIATAIAIALFLAAIGLVVGVLIGRGSHRDDDEAGPVGDTLNLLNERLSSLERQGASGQAQLEQHVTSIANAGIELRQQTQALSNALVRPEVRGHWGEMQLRRCLELAGLTAHCAFEEQPTFHTEDGVRRPDVVINLPGDKFIVVDSKVSLDAFLSANRSNDAENTDAQLRNHARQMRNHVDDLSTKAYWNQFPTSPEFVVMFIPTEAGFAAALETDPGLIGHAAAKRVMLATPTTLIAMLRTVASTWTQDAVAENVREVHRLGRELYERLATFATHLDSLGGSMATATKHYNNAVGSLETRVLSTARKMGDLGVVGDDLPTPRQINDAVKPPPTGDPVPDDGSHPGANGILRRVIGE